jgi:hypothetical protein
VTEPSCACSKLANGVKHVVLLPPTPEASILAEQLGGVQRNEPDPSGRVKKPTQRTFPIRPAPALLNQVVSLGGFWFTMGGSCQPQRLTTCLFIPSGWWHWLLNDSEWHVAWSGSFFPDADRER